MDTITINTQTENLLIKYDGKEAIITGNAELINNYIRWIKEYRHYEEIDEKTFILLSDIDFRGCKLKAKMLGCYILP